MPTAVPSSSSNHTHSSSTLRHSKAGGVDKSGHSKEEDQESSPISNQMSGDRTVKVTLRNLYEKAKHAFLQRDLLGAERLLTLAFAQLPPPTDGGRDVDGLDSQRRKWDILRITLWTTLFMSKDSASSSSLEKKTNCPVHLGPIQFLEKLYSNSLRLFTPSSSTDPSSNQAGGIGYVPDQVVFLLVVSALKLDQVRLAKEWIEDWLVRRDPTIPMTTTLTEGNAKEMTSYEKVVDVYVLRVLPRLGLWDDATEFLRYEAEMNEYAKQRITKALQAQYHASESGIHSRSRDASPTPSLASSTSTTTIPTSLHNGTTTPTRPASAASISSSASTATVRPGPHQSQTNNTESIVKSGGSELLAMTSMKVDKGKGRDLSDGNTGSREIPPVQPSHLLSSPSSSGNGSPLPVPPLYQNGHASASKLSPSTQLHTRHLTRVYTITQNYFLQVYLYLATILNTHFALQLPTEEVISLLPVPLHNDAVINWNPKPRLWHLFFVFTVLMAVVRLFRGRGRRTGIAGGAGESARKKLRSQMGRGAGWVVGPRMGVEFWKAAMRAVGDAVGMAGRGLV